MARRAGRQIAAEQYYDAAMSILAREGAAGLKIGPLCRSLGVTSGSFYHHFGGWAGFVRGLLRYWEAEQTDRIVELARATADPVERIDVVKQLTVALRHDAEAAIRAWAQIDPRSAAPRRGWTCSAGSRWSRWWPTSCPTRTTPAGSPSSASR
ncbi:hypothetical protein WY02_12605 [Pseudonocardia sp. AL041005-10]|nr:hypothetical protein WY02_12605 [Pseudonocardia sp. AL041005-10]